MASSSSDSSSLLQIKKLEGSRNYDVWQTQCYNVLLQKKQHVPIKSKGVKPALVTDEEWEAMYELNTHGRSQSRGRNQERRRSTSRSSRDVVCYYCGKKGHLKKQCYKYKNDMKGQEEER